MITFIVFGLHKLPRSVNLRPMSRTFD